MEQDLSCSHDRFLGYVVRNVRTGEFRSHGARPAPVVVPPYVATPAWAHRYENIEEAREAAQRSDGEVVMLCDRAGHYAVARVTH
jgi:hypothetical protein